MQLVLDTQLHRMQYLPTPARPRWPTGVETMAKTYRFQVTGPNCRGTRSVISRHETLKAAQQAAAKGTADFRVEEIKP